MLSKVESDRFVVVLVHPRNPLNIGAAARALSNFGLHRLRLVAPYEVAFRNAKSAVGAAELLQQAQQFDTLAEAIDDCQPVVGTTAVRHRGLHHPVRELDLESGKAFRAALADGPAALLFGSERYGLSNEDLSHCNWLLRIRTPDDHPSMNLGQAVAVCLYELTRSEPIAELQSSQPVGDAIEFATAGDQERILTSLMESLSLSEYVKRFTEESVRENARRFIRRLRLERRDAELWLGMLRQTLWKLKGGNHEKNVRAAKVDTDIS